MQPIRLRLPDNIDGSDNKKYRRYKVTFLLCDCRMLSEDKSMAWTWRSEDHGDPTEETNGVHKYMLWGFLMLFLTRCDLKAVTSFWHRRTNSTKLLKSRELKKVIGYFEDILRYNAFRSRSEWKRSKWGYNQSESCFSVTEILATNRFLLRAIYASGSSG